MGRFSPACHTLADSLPGIDNIVVIVPDALGIGRSFGLLNGGIVALLDLNIKMPLLIVPGLAFSVAMIDTPACPPDAAVIVSLDHLPASARPARLAFVHITPVEPNEQTWASRLPLSGLSEEMEEDDSPLALRSANRLAQATSPPTFDLTRDAPQFSLLSLTRSASSESSFADELAPVGKDTRESEEVWSHMHANVSQVRGRLLSKSSPVLTPHRCCTVRKRAERTSTSRRSSSRISPVSGAFPSCFNN